MRDLRNGFEVLRVGATLAGHVDRYTEKCQAEPAAQRVEAVVDLAAEYEVKPPGGCVVSLVRVFAHDCSFGVIAASRCRARLAGYPPKRSCSGQLPGREP